MICPHCNIREITRYKNTCDNCYSLNQRLRGNAFLVLSRDKYTCVSCGKYRDEVKRLEIHHLDGNGSRKPKIYRNDSPENLVTLCTNCHYNVEFKRRGNNGQFKYINKWSKLYDACVECGKSDRPHACKGRCSRCYQYTRREYKARYWREHYKI